jgi:hypothetical protein
MELVNFYHHVRLVIMLYDFAERTEQGSDTGALIAYFMMQTACTKFCLHQLINFRVQTRVEKTQYTHTHTHRALFITRIFDALCAHNALKYEQGRAIWK